MRAEIRWDITGPDTLETLAHILTENWGLRHVPWQPLPSGHTNTSHIILDDAAAKVLRVSWPHKAQAQVERECSVLAHLLAYPALPAVPRICPTRDGQPCISTADGRWLHLFERIDGTPGLPAAVYDGIRQAMHALAHLHMALAGLPTAETNPVAWLLERYRRVAARPAPPMAEAAAVHYKTVLRYIGSSLTAAATDIPGPVQWLHGDYHAGNVLFDGARISGIVDFDDVGCGSTLLEVAFALFAFSRNVSCEERFDFDPALWALGLHTYAENHERFDPAWLLRHRDTLCELFCIDQVLIHLEAAQRGLWPLTPGIGFFACWHHTQACCEASLVSSV
jgi:Ser/Thr protein kinase RdoA (MazF antagonist)